MQNTELADFIDFAKAWADLGPAIAAQVAYVADDLDGGTTTDADINPAAIETAYRRLRGLNDDLDTALLDYLQSVR